ncbi:hypothetical protein AMS68_006565 [Peltaster fructicola]|uniref:Cytochrome P450 n=1 Tax=Peltaster fructicola TaxID=286661 RepID=A0A6H0Y2H1_9PEZI|nr:hypothetical protein AMS68_006565 [Peltaster fructicola]
MPSILLIVGALLLAATLIYPYRLIRNFYYAKRANVPYVVIPFDQDATLWMVLSVPLRPVIQRWLPTWLKDRLLITIWGWEFHESSKPFERWGKPMGNNKTMAWVTAGLFEINSWDAEFATEVLKRPKDFQEPHFNTIFVGRFGHNILTTNGEHWARQRKIMAQVVNERISKVVFNETVQQTHGLLEEVFEHGEKTTADTYSAFDMMKKITIHVLSGAGMGKPVSWSGNDETPGAGYKMTYMDASKTVMEGMAGPIILPQWLFDNYPSFLPGYGYIKRLGCAVREYPLHTKAILDAERERVKQPGEMASSNIVSQMLQASEGVRAGTGLTESEMVGNLFIFTAAGFDTTANTLSYALAVLAWEPKWQTWIFAEIDEIMPQDRNAELDYASIFPKAIRVMALMLETLRLYTPLVHIPKATYGEQTVTTSKHTYRLPHNTTIYINAIALHKDPAVWRDLNRREKDKPTDLPDEDVFRPTRWINDDGKLFQPAKGTYLPWSAGPRNCPGMKMAQVEFTATILTIFRAHKIAAVPLQIPDPGVPGLGTREESLEEVQQRIAARVKDSLSILTLQMNNVYDVTKSSGESLGIKLRFSRR